MIFSVRGGSETQLLPGAVHALIAIFQPHGHGPGDLAGHGDCQRVPWPQHGVPAKQCPHPYIGEMGVCLTVILKIILRASSKASLFKDFKLIF